MDYYWRCRCGDKTLNTPDGEGLRTIRRHRMLAMKNGESGHYIEGLFDEHGACLIPGDNAQDALRQGYLDRLPETKRRKKNGQAGQILQSEGGGRTPSNLQGVLTAMRIALPPSTWGWLALGFQYLRKADGTPFQWNEEDVGLYISDVIAYFHQEHLATFLGLTSEQAAEPAIRGQLEAFVQAINRMDNNAPALPVEMVRGEQHGL